MLKNKVIQRTLVSVFMLVLALLTGFIGITALKKSFDLRISYFVNPRILCEIQYKTEGGASFQTLFRNYHTEGIDTEINNELISLNESKFSMTFNSTLQPNFELKILNYTTDKLHVEIKGGCVAYDSIVLDAFNGTTAQQGILSVNINALQQTLDYAPELNFSIIENGAITPAFNGVEFDLDYINNNLLPYDGNYYVPKGFDAVSRLKVIDGALNSVSVSSPSSVHSYNSTTKEVSIPNANLTNNITLTATTQSYSLTVNTYDGVGDESSTEVYTNSAVRTPQTITLTAPTNYSVPASIEVSGNANYTYNPTDLWNKATLEIMPTANCTISVRYNPWIYGTYVATETATDTATIWAGYHYVLFNGAENTASNRWIVIGESEKVFNYGLLPASSPALLNDTDSIQVTHTGYSAPNVTSTPGIRPKTRMFQELTNSQVLLLKETLMTNTTTWSSSTPLKTFVNTATDSIYCNSAGLTSDINTNYIASVDLYTTYKNASTESKELRKESAEKIFVLSTLAGIAYATASDNNLSLLNYDASSIAVGANSNGLGVMHASITATDKVLNASTWASSGINYGGTNKEIYIMQNFNLEMYLGGYTNGTKASNYKILNNANSTILRSGDIGFVSGTGQSSVGFQIMTSDSCITSTYSDNCYVQPAFVLNLA